MIFHLIRHSITIHLISSRAIVLRKRCMLDMCLHATSSLARHDAKLAASQVQQCDSAKCWSAAAPLRRPPPFNSAFGPLRRSSLRWHGRPCAAAGRPQSSGSGGGAAASKALLPAAASPHLHQQQLESSVSTFCVSSATARLAQQATTAALAVLLAATMLASPAPAQAADTAKVGTCLLSSCQVELAGCLADSKCAQNLICLQTCNGRPDETDCQVSGLQFSPGNQNEIFSSNPDVSALRCVEAARAKCQDK